MTTACNARLSSSSSATTCFSCRFSSSSCRSRRASLTSIPPYFAFQRYRLPRVYEEYLAAKLGSGATVDEQERSAIWKERASDSIEHIFPQNPGSEPGLDHKMQGEDGIEKEIQHHVGRIGNLLLLPNILNSQAKIRPFSEKKAIYAKHNLRMISEVTAESDWTLSSIERREALITMWAKTRWADL